MFEGSTRFQAFIRNIVTAPETRLIKNLQRYEHLTLGMINQAMLSGRWTF